MTARRIFKSDKPMRRFEPIVFEPMTKEQAQFWKLLREQKPELYGKGG